MYLSTIMDLFNNEIVADHQQTPLVIDTFKEAPEMHGNSEDVIIHANQGNVYTSFAYQELVKKSHLISNMSRRRNCWDNAVIESFHSNIKSEEFQYVKFNSMHNIQVVEKVDEYMRYYNEDRILEKLGYLAPKEFKGKQSKEVFYICLKSLYQSNRLHLLLYYSLNFIF